MSLVSQRKSRSTLGILIAARAKIEDPERWTQGQLARGASGHPQRPSSPNAVCWCAQGACYAVASSEWMARDALYLLNDAAKRDGCKAIWTMNDRAKNAHGRVLVAFDHAIRVARSFERDH